jgi:protein SCO1/2
MKSGLGQWLLVAGLALVLAGSYLTWRSLHAGPAPAGEVPSVTEIRDDAQLPAFTLHGPRGEFGNAQLTGHWSFVFFGYTQCPDICPTALALMKELGKTLAAVAPAPTFQVVFVSVDPRRDTPQLLGEYMAAFDPSFVGISGTDAALSPLTKSLGVYYQRNDADGYTQLHGRPFGGDLPDRSAGKTRCSVFPAAGGIENGRRLPSHRWALMAGRCRPDDKLHFR